MPIRDPNAPSLTRRRLLHILGGVPPALLLLGCSDSDGLGESPTPTSPTSPAERVSSASTEGYFRITPGPDKHLIECNGVPNHLTGEFPNRGCPHAIRARALRFEIPARPEIATAPRPIDGWLFGVAINGVVFDPTGPYFFEGTRRVMHFEVMSGDARPHLGLDFNNAHSQPSGEYHYHGLPVGLLDGLGANAAMTLIGYAADGFPIYGPAGYDDATNAASLVRAMRSSYRLRSGRRPEVVVGGEHDGTFVEDYVYVEGHGDLDECNGRFGVTPEYPDGIYHYYVTSQFPFVPRAWRGAPDPSFAHGSPGPDAVPPALRNYRGRMRTEFTAQQQERP